MPSIKQLGFLVGLGAVIAGAVGVLSIKWAIVIGGAGVLAGVAIPDSQA